MCRRQRRRMIETMFLALALLLFLILPDPWNVVGGVVSLACGVVEITYWQRRMRRVKVATGVENLIGATGEVTTPLAPVGQIRVLGELWEARSSSELPERDDRARRGHGRADARRRAGRPVTERSRSLERRRAPESLPVGLAGAVEIG